MIKLKEIYIKILKEAETEDMFGDLGKEIGTEPPKPNEKPSQYLNDVYLNSIQKFLPSLKREGVEVIPKQLGRGTQGAVYATTDGKILKITADKSEANSAAYINGKKLKNIYEVYDVYQFGESGYYGILQEKLEKLEAMPAQVQDLIEMFNEYAKDPRATPDDYIKRSFSLMKKAGIDYNKYSKLFYDVANAAEELKKNKIFFSDFSHNNVMKRKNGDYVIIDLGYSKGPGGNIKRL